MDRESGGTGGTSESLPCVPPTDALASPGLRLGWGFLPGPGPGQVAALAAEQDEKGSKGCRPPRAPRVPLIPAPVQEHTGKEPGCQLLGR